jgi:hypothetical protein
MFVVLIGLNGVHGPKGGYLLWTHAATMLAMIVGSGFAAHWLEQLLVRNQGWSPWLAGPAIVLGVPLCVAVLFFVCFAVLTTVVGLK